MNEEPVVFASMIEGLFVKGLEGRVTPALIAEVKALGIDLTKPLLVAYPLTSWQKIMLVTATHLYPQLEKSMAVEQLGRDFMHGFEHTLVGGAIFTMARLIGVERTMQRMTKNQRSTTNAYESRLEKVGPGHLRLTTVATEAVRPGIEPWDRAVAFYMLGICKGVFEALKVTPTSLTCEPGDVTVHATTIDMQWQP